MTRNKFAMVLVLMMSAAMSFAEGGKVLFILVGTGIKDPVTAIAAAYERNTGVKVELNFGNCGNLLGQLSLNPKGDLLFPGSMETVEKVRAKGLVTSISEPLAYLIPVIVTPKGNPAKIKTVDDLAKPGVKLILPDKVATSLGVMAFKVFDRRKITAGIDANVLAFMESPQKVVAAILLGQGDAGIVDASTTVKNMDRLELIPIDPSINEREKLVGVVLSCAEQRDLAEDFLKFASAEGPAIFSKYGFQAAR